VDNEVVKTPTVGVMPAPAPVGPTIERSPAVKVEIPGVPLVEIVPPSVIEIKAEIAVPTEFANRAMGAVKAVAVPTVSYAAVALGVVTLGVAVAVRRR